MRRQSDALIEFISSQTVAGQPAAEANNATSEEILGSEVRYLLLNSGQRVAVKPSVGLLETGRRVNLVEVIGQPVRSGRHGAYSNGEYICQCVAPLKTARGQLAGQICGKILMVKYQRLYSGRIYSCDCTPRPKHPPVRFEGQHFGRVEVLRWAEEEWAWEMVCHECGAVLYRKNAREVYAAGESCRTHKQAHLRLK